MPTETDIYGLPVPAGDDAPPHLPTVLGALADRLEEVLAAGIRSSGAASIAAAQATSSSSYVELGTPDRVSDIVLPEDGLIFIAYQALVKESVLGAMRAAIFLDAGGDAEGVNQLKARTSAVAPAVQETTLGSVNNVYIPLSSCPSGLTSGDTDTLDHTSDVETGQIVGARQDLTGRAGILAVFAAADTYDVSIRFKASSGTVTAKERTLWVWSQAFGMPPP